MLAKYQLKQHKNSNLIIKKIEINMNNFIRDKEAKDNTKYNNYEYIFHKTWPQNHREK